MEPTQRVAWPRVDATYREVNELLLQLRTRDALLADEVLAALPIALTVHLPRAFWSLALVLKGAKKVGAEAVSTVGTRARVLGWCAVT